MNELSKSDMSTATFRVVYDGPALAEHTMDVRDLSPALLAIAAALEEANRILNGDRAQVRVQVHGSFKTGSFGIDLDVTQAFIAQALDFLAAPPPDQKTQINEMEFTAPLQLVSVPLRDGYKWRIDDGNGAFTATVLDERFVQRIQKSEIAFSARDFLFARIRRRQFLDGVELRNENEIIEVVRHEPAYKQIPLPIIRPDA